MPPRIKAAKGAQGLRVRKGREAVVTGSEQGDSRQERVIDSLTNIMHYCAKEGENFQAALTIARRHFDEEYRGDALYLRED